MCLIRQIFGKMAEYSAFYRILGIRPNVPIRQNIRTFFGSECSYSAESENPVSFEHWSGVRKTQPYPDRGSKLSHVCCNRIYCNSMSPGSQRAVP